jgi:ribosomal protein L12E/L44/L45/RPP1/RPP2
VVALLQGPTLCELTERIGRQLATAAAPAAEPAAAPRGEPARAAAGRDRPEELLAQIDQLSESELDGLLAELNAEEGAARPV